MSTEDLKAHYERILEELFHQGKLDAMDKYFAPTWVMHRPWGSEGFEEVKKGWAAALGAFPNLRFTVHDFDVVGDKMVIRYTMRGTHRGPWLGMLATGKQMEQWGIEIDRLENGKIVETWSAYDRLGIMQQLGAMPAPEPSTA